MRATRLRGALVGVFAFVLLPGAAVAAPTISGADGDVWNAQTAPASYDITGDAEGAVLTWQLQRDGAATPLLTGTGPSPLRVTLGEAPDGALRLVAEQPGALDPGPSARTFTLDTLPPTIAIARPVARAVYDQGERVLADFSCSGAVTCVGTVADGAPLDTASLGTRTFAVTAGDRAGNTADRSVEYLVAAVAPVTTPPAATPAAVPAGTPIPPSPPIRLAPPSGAAPQDPDLPEVLNAKRLQPAAGASVGLRRPVLGWTRVGAARLYNLQVFRVRDGRATQVLSAFPTGNRFRVPAGRLAWGQRYVWRVWPLIGNSYSSAPHGLSWFEVRRPVRLTRAQLLVNQRISQAALRRTTAISEWLDAGLVTSDLRDGGLGPQDFGGDVTLAGAGTAIDNGFAAPRPLVAPPPARSGTSRVRVSARQLLVNQRISQAAVRRANALAARLEGGLTGGDLREGAVAATKLAPGLRISSAAPAGPAPAASTTAVRAAATRPRARVKMTDGQALINQRISQAAVRRANGLATLIGGGLTGAQFRDGAITASSVAPSLR